MAYVAGLYTKASQASADEAKRFRDFQTQIDEMGARERAGLMRQQQAAMDRQMAGLVQPGQLYTPETLPRVSPAGTSVATSPLPAMMPEQQIQPELTAPAGAAPAPAAGLTPFRMSPGPIEAGGTQPPSVAPTGDQTKTGFEQVLQGAKPVLQRRYNTDILEKLRVSPLQGAYDFFFTPTGEVASKEQTAKLNTEASTWYASEAVRNFITSDQTAYAEAARDPVGYYQKNKDKIGKKAAAPAAAAPAEQPAPGGAQPVPAPTSVGIDTTGATPAPLASAKEVPLSDPAKQAASTQMFESLAARTSQVPTVVASARGQRTIRRALELGADPAAVLALSGIETEFGANIATDPVTGAGGLLQVTPDTYAEMKAFFTNPAEIKRRKIPSQVVEAAQNMTPGSEDAGILRVLYNDIIGVPKNLWGAAYFGNAEAVKKAGAPLAIPDRNGLSQSDYNKAYIALYNEARNYVGLEPNAQMADYEATAPLRLQEIDTNEQLELTNYNNEIGLLQTQNERILAQRNIIAQQIAFAQQSGFANRIPALQQQLLQIDDLLMQVTQQANQLNAGYQTKFNEFNMQRTTEFSNVAIGRMLRGDPRSLSEQWSRAYGEPVTIQRRSDGKYNIFMGADGRRMSPAAGMTPEEVAYMFKMEFDSAFSAQEAEQRQKARDAAVQHDRKLQELMIQQVGDIEVAKINKAPVPGFSKPEPVRYDPETGVAIEFISQGEGAYAGEIMRIKSPPQQELKDGILTIDQAIITRERRPGPQ